MRLSLLLCSLLLAIFNPASAIPHRHFVEWFPSYAPVFRNITHDSCSHEISWYHNASGDPGLAIACILDHVSEFHKANLAAAGVILGVLPTILSLAGTSTAESGLLAMRRPVLAALLVAGAPVVSPIRSSDFADPVRVLTVDYGDAVLGISRLGGAGAWLLLGLEYVLAAAAAANLVLLGVELGVKGVCSFSAGSVFQPLLWALLAVPIHLVGAAALRLRLRITDADPRRNRLVRNELTLCMLQPDVQLRLEKKTLLFVFVSWVTSIGTLVHIVYGTLVLSSTLFVAPPDALVLAGRYFASTVVCRVVFTFEISGMAERIKAGQGVEEKMAEG